MSFSYYNIKKHPRNFRNITGLTVEEFEKVVEKVRPEWEKVEKQKKCHGRRSQLPTLEDKGTFKEVCQTAFLIQLNF
ncbi:MAG: hypothetical protein TV41_06965 [Wolbachia endosymbiont of Dactylopius coccus]|nr:MAG: hypothetical protein TV41_06965 [Wolbachia endosymbiont of Dactylopius coccus]